MNDCKKCQDLFIEALYDELGGERKEFFKDHLLICEKCKSEYGKMAAALKIMSKRIRPEPGQAFWTGYADRLAKKMRKAKLALHSSESFRQTIIRILASVPKWAFQASAALFLVILGVFIGRMMFSPPASETRLAQQPPARESQIDVIHRAQNYIERSKLIILAMVNFDPKTEDPYGLSLPRQKQISKELVQEASFLKEKLEDTHQRRLLKLIIDLEVILLQIANLETENDFEAVELIKGGVESRGILLKIYLTDVRKLNEEMERMEPKTKGLNRSGKI